MTTDRVVIVGGPRTGKSTLAGNLSRDHSLMGCSVYCGDPLSKVTYPELDVQYLPENLAMENGSTRYIVEHWFSLPGPWVCEGWIMARALRKWMTVMQEIEESRPGLVMQEYPCDKVIVFREQRDDQTLKPGQVAQHKGVMRVWDEISYYFEPITEVSAG